MGFQFPNLEWYPDSGIKVIIPLLMKFEVSPDDSIAQKVRKSMGAISSTFS